MLSLISNHLETLTNLPVKLLKLSLESILVKQIAYYLGKFLSIFYLHLSADVLLVLAFVLAATLAYYIIAFIVRLLFGSNTCHKSRTSRTSSRSSSSCSESSSCSVSLCSSSSKTQEIPSVSSCSSVSICTSCTF